MTSPSREDSSTATTAPEASTGTAPSATPAPAAAAASGAGVVRPGDRIFQILSVSASWLITILIAAVGLFLLWRAVPALNNNVANFFTYGGTWDLADTSAMKFGIPNLFLTTVAVSLVALILAMPVALGIAIFLSNYAPKQWVRPLGFLVDLLAAVPSIVYGIWGFMVLGPFLGPFYEWLNGWAGGFFLFATYQSSPPFSTSRNLFTGGIVLAIMILPVIASTAREVFIQTPKGHIESALALGATRWEVVRLTVLPFGLSGYISGSMLGLGRALGETMALYMVMSPAAEFRWSLFEGGNTFATHIALHAQEFNNDLMAGAYMSAGLVLFILTFVVNAAARAVVNRKK